MSIYARSAPKGSGNGGLDPTEYLGQKKMNRPWTEGNPRISRSWIPNAAERNPAMQIEHSLYPKPEICEPSPGFLIPRIPATLPHRRSAGANPLNLNL